MNELTKQFLEALGRELGFAPQATDDGLVPLQVEGRRALLHFRSGGEALALYAEIGRPAASRRERTLAHFMAGNFLLSLPGAAAFSYVVDDNMLGLNMRLGIHGLDAPAFLRTLEAFLNLAAENAAQLDKMNETAPAPRNVPTDAPSDGVMTGIMEDGILSSGIMRV